MAPRTRTLLEADPFAMDPTSEQFFADGEARPSAPEPAEDPLDDLAELHPEEARRSSLEVVLRRRRYRRVVHRVVLALGAVALVGFAKGRLASSPAMALHAGPPTAAVALVPAVEPASAPPVAVEPASAPPVAVEPAAVVPAESPPVAAVPKAKHAVAAKRDDDFAAELDIKIDVPKIDVPVE